ncbi:LemA family protein [Candidatus Micrarchaeota archaeon]|nr:LemA family protein [Candidatus Micrarchaeota archaeon]
MSGETEQNNSPILFVFLMAIALWLYLKSLRLYQLSDKIKYTPTTKVIAATPGVVEISGKAESAGLTVSPISHKKCAYYFLLVERYIRAGKSSRWAFTLSEYADCFYVNDRTGRILVFPLPGNTRLLPEFVGISKDLDKSFQRVSFSNIFFSEEKKKFPKHIDKFIDQNPVLRNYANKGYKLRFTEYVIDINQDVYVIGKAIENPDNDARLMITNNKKDTFYLAESNEKKVLSHVTSSTTFGVFCGVFGVPFFVFLVLHGLKINPLISILLAMFIYFIFIGWLSWVRSIALYNGIVLLRRNVDRARANIDVLLEKRSVLIPNLVKVVKKSTKYESSLLTEITKLRTFISSDDFIHKLESESSKNKVKTLLAVLEKYPELKANKNYLLLQEQLDRIETEIAESRSFYNDSVTIYNTWIKKFPFLFIARFIGFKPIKYIKIQ